MIEITLSYVLPQQRKVGDLIAKNLGLPLNKIQKSKLQHICISDTLPDE
jgi:hypothetical protein